MQNIYILGIKLNLARQIRNLTISQNTIHYLKCGEYGHGAKRHTLSDSFTYFVWQFHFSHLLLSIHSLSRWAVMLALCSSSGPLIFQDVVGHCYGCSEKFHGETRFFYFPFTQRQHCHYIKHQRNPCIPGWFPVLKKRRCGGKHIPAVQLIIYR